MRFDIITIFPDIFNSYFNESIIKRAQKNNLINIKIHNLRDFAEGRYKKVDDTPYGGGAGMIMKVEPIYRAVQNVQNVQVEKDKKTIKTITTNRTRIILFSAKGKRYTQSDAKRLSKYDNLILICGRYEGVDERVAKYVADEEISVGDYVLTGGEIPAMIIVDSVARLLPGVLGNPKSLEAESFSMVRQKADAKSLSEIKKFEKICEYPQYTKPEKFSVGSKIWKVPKILLSGDHKKIEGWRKNKSKKTKA